MVALGRTCTPVAVVPLSGPVPSLVPLGTRAEDTHPIGAFRRNSPPLPFKSKDQTCAGADLAPMRWAVNFSSDINDVPAAGVSGHQVEREPTGFLLSLFKRHSQTIVHKVARFRQVNLENLSTHHDALEFPDGQIVLLTHLRVGQRATVLQLPVQGKAWIETKEASHEEVARSDLPLI